MRLFGKLTGNELWAMGYGLWAINNEELKIKNESDGVMKC